MALLRTLFPLRHVESGMVLIAGNFMINGTSNPDNIVLKGVDSVTRTGVGTFTFQLPGKGSYNLAAAKAGVSGVGLLASLSMSSSGLVTIVTSSLVTDAPAEPADDSILYVEITLSDTSVPRK